MAAEAEATQPTPSGIRRCYRGAVEVKNLSFWHDNMKEKMEYMVKNQV